MQYPLYKEIAYSDPFKIFSLFYKEHGAIFLDSALLHESLGRYSYIAIDPLDIIESKNGKVISKDFSGYVNPFTFLNALMQKYACAALPDLPPFQGGLAGYFGYELYQHLEKIPFAHVDDMNFPDMMIGVYDLVIAFDNILQKTFVFSSGKQKEKRLEFLLKKLDTANFVNEESSFLLKKNFQSDFTRETYCDAVQKVINYILAGDIFEANLSQRFSTTLPENFSTFSLYKRLREINPASFAAYVNFSPIILLSASPERFLKMLKNQIETRPIKGTRRRGKTKEEDEKNAVELTQSAKDHAENVMIVDLMRNDLSRVCEPHSIDVPQLCGLESFATVHHLVSVVKGKLNENLNAFDLLRASFPGGSITGAPKIRAMEIIAEMEPTYRGPYCGSIGYINWSGDMDTSITIRTIAISGDKISFQVGGAVVADSNPEEEYEETLTKGRALFEALTNE